MKNVELRDFLLGSLRKINKSGLVWEDKYLFLESPELIIEEVKKRIDTMSLLTLYKNCKYGIDVMNSDSTRIEVGCLMVTLYTGNYNDDPDVETTYGIITEKVTNEIHEMLDKLHFWNDTIDKKIIDEQDEKVQKIMEEINKL